MATEVMDGEEFCMVPLVDVIKVPKLEPSLGFTVNFRKHSLRLILELFEPFLLSGQPPCLGLQFLRKIENLPLNALSFLKILEIRMYLLSPRLFIFTDSCAYAISLTAAFLFDKIYISVHTERGVTAGISHQHPADRHFTLTECD